MLEARSDKSFPVVVHLDGSPDATDVSSHALRYVLGKVVLQRDIADGKPAARLQNSSDLAKYSRLVGSKIKHTVGDNTVNGSIRQWNFFVLAQVDLAVGVSATQRVGPGALDHRRRHVDANGTSR